MATAPRKKTARKTTARVPKASDGFEPVRLSSKPVDEERIPFFYIDDAEYTIPKFVSKTFAMGLMKRAREIGDELAIMEAFEKVIGEDAYQALVDCPSVTEEQVDQLMTVFRDRVLGPPEGKGPQ